MKATFEDLQEIQDLREALRIVQSNPSQGGAICQRWAFLDTYLERVEHDMKQTGSG